MRALILAAMILYSKSLIAQCPLHDYLSTQERAKKLVNLYAQINNANTTNSLDLNQEFFCAFPSDFEGMEQLFGYDDKLGPGPLYSSSESTLKYQHKFIYSDLIGLFSELSSVDLQDYFKKYISININGEWNVDNISNGFGIYYRIINDTEEFCSALSKFDPVDIKSMFHFIFDGPHPINARSRHLYHSMKEQICIVDKSITMHLDEVYEEILQHGDHDH